MRGGIGGRKSGPRLGAGHQSLSHHHCWTTTPIRLASVEPRMDSAGDSDIWQATDWPSKAVEGWFKPPDVGLAVIVSQPYYFPTCDTGILC